MIVIALKDIFFATELAEIAASLDKKVEFAATAAELKKLAPGSVAVIADVEKFSPAALEKVKQKGTALIGYMEKKDAKKQREAEKVCNVVVTKEEMEKKFIEMLSKL